MKELESSSLFESGTDDEEGAGRMRAVAEDAYILFSDFNNEVTTTKLSTSQEKIRKRNKAEALLAALLSSAKKREILNIAIDSETPVEQRRLDNRVASKKKSG